MRRLFPIDADTFLSFVFVVIFITVIAVVAVGGWDIFVVRKGVALTGVTPFSTNRSAPIETEVKVEYCVRRHAWADDDRLMLHPGSIYHCFIEEGLIPQ